MPMPMLGTADDDDAGNTSASTIEILHPVIESRSLLIVSKA
jgi:hypothetical protein